MKLPLCRLYPLNGSATNSEQKRLGNAKQWLLSLDINAMRAQGASFLILNKNKKL